MFFDGGTIRYTSAEGKVDQRTVARGTARFIARGTVDAEEAIDGTPRAVVVEIK